MNFIQICAALHFLEGAPQPLLNLALNAASNLHEMVNGAILGNGGVNNPLSSRGAAAEKRNSIKGPSRLIGFQTGLNVLGSHAGFDIGLNTAGTGYDNHEEEPQVRRGSGTRRRQNDGNGMGINASLKIPFLRANIGTSLSAGRRHTVHEIEDEEEEEDEDDENEAEAQPRRQQPILNSRSKTRGSPHIPTANKKNSQPLKTRASVLQDKSKIKAKLMAQPSDSDYESDDSDVEFMALQHVPSTKQKRLMAKKIEPKAVTNGYIPTSRQITQD